jgi:hypothetical protein
VSIEREDGSTVHQALAFRENSDEASDHLSFVTWRRRRLEYHGGERISLRAWSGSGWLRWGTRWRGRRATSSRRRPPQGLLTTSVPTKVDNERPHNVGAFLHRTVQEIGRGAGDRAICPAPGRDRAPWKMQPFRGNRRLIPGPVPVCRCQTMTNCEIGVRA